MRRARRRGAERRRRVDDVRDAARVARARHRARATTTTTRARVRVSQTRGRSARGRRVTTTGRGMATTLERDGAARRGDDERSGIKGERGLANASETANEDLRY
jgi:hypothetical protein